MNKPVKLDKPPSPRPTVADLPEKDYVFVPARDPIPSRTESRVIATFAKLGTSMDVVEDVVRKTGISPMAALRLGGHPPLDPRSEHGKYLMELYEYRRGAALR